MTRYRYHTATTLDGFLADDSNSLAWLFKHQIDKDGPGSIPKFLAEVGAQVMGATTYLCGWPAPDQRAYLAQAEAPGAYFFGDPDDVAEHIVQLHGHMGHMRHFLQMDSGGLPQEHFLESLTLLATEVKPRVNRLLAKK